MAEYIEREALVRQIICNMAEFIGAPDDAQKHDEQCNYAISMIENTPAADVAPVVWCRDCKHCKEVAYREGRGFFCAIWGRGWYRVQPDDFCSYGERKDGDGDD